MKILQFPLLLFFIGTICAENIIPELGFTSRPSARFAFIGKTVKFTLTLNNTSSILIKNAKVSYELPNYLEYVSSEPQANVKIAKKYICEWSIDVPKKAIKYIKITTRIVLNTSKSTANNGYIKSVFLLHYLETEKKTISSIRGV